jgi:lipid II:glycine glycyltransferase (peptidoglycan interpeptide bridge formation enzyme)
LRLNPYFCGDAAIGADKILRQSGFKDTRGGSGDYQATVSVDLASSDDVLWDRLSPSVKRQIRKAERLGIDVIRDRSGELAEGFFERCYEAAVDNEFGLPGGRRAVDAYHAMRGTSAKAALFISQHDGRQVAGIALMPAGNRAIYEWGYSGSEPEDRKLPLSHRLHWEALRWARKSGFQFYDMGGYWVDRGDQDPINRFKLGFSPENQAVLGEYFFPLSPILGRLTEVAIRARRWNVTGSVHE